MNNVKLPLNVLPPAVSDSSSSALARYLSVFLKSYVGSNIVPYDLVPAIMEGALGMAVMAPFDPEEKIILSKDQHIPLLEAVLRLGNVNRMVPVHRPWPTKPELFDSSLAITKESGERYAVDNEWVAAALTAAGCNPWRDHAGKEDIPPSVKLAIEYGYAGLVERFLSLPGAYSAQEIAESVNEYKGESKSAIEYIASKNNGIGLLKVLVEAGARLKQEGLAVSVYSSAKAPAIELLSKFDHVELSSASKKKIKSTWQSRIVENSLSSLDLPKMELNLWNESSENLSTAALDIGKTLSVGWGSRANGSYSEAYHFMGNTGKEKLLGKGILKSGPLAGEWSLLAAAIVSRIKQGQNYGCLGWSIGVMIENQFNNLAKGWVSADVSIPDMVGSLSNAIGFDWRPGISINGPVMLGLLGQTNGHEVNEKNDGLQEQQVLERIHDFSIATNIKNIEQWAFDYAPDAVRFTAAVLKGGQVSISCRLLEVWDRAMTRMPRIISALTEDDRLELLKALTNKFTISSLYRKGAMGFAYPFERVSQSLFPGIDPNSFEDDRELYGAQKTAALIRMFVETTNNFYSIDQDFKKIKAQIEDLTEDDLALVSAWGSNMKSADSNMAEQINAYLEAVSLERKTKPAISTGKKGMRL